MVVVQKVKEADITEQDSLLLTKNLLRIAIFNISYIRGLFPEKYFDDKNVPALEMKIKKLTPRDAESRRLIDWMEKGVYDALQKKYLKTLLFCICETIDGPMIEEYSFSFSYSESDSREVSMNINRSGNKKRGGTFKCNSETEVTPAQMRSSACKMVRTLIQLMRTLDKMPEERTILMKLCYYEDVTPTDYEPPFFRGCTPEESRNHWTENPLKMDVGNVNSRHVILALKVKSALDPCDDDDDIQDNDVSLDDDSVLRDDSSDYGSEANSSPDNHVDQYIVAPIEKKQPCKGRNSPAAGNSQHSEETQNALEDERQFNRVKDWINSCQIETLETTDVLANFPDISVALIEVIMDKLLEVGVLFKSGRDSFGIRKKEVYKYEFHVKEEENDQGLPDGYKTPLGGGEHHMYMKALYYALPMEYVTVTKLQRKLKGEASQTAVRKLVDKMARDGFVEARSSRKLGKRVIRSDLTEMKLSEVRKVLDKDSMDEDSPLSQTKLNYTEPYKMVSNNIDGSTCGALHSIGSDLTRTRGKSGTNQNGLLRNQKIVPGKDILNTPIRNSGPVASRESMIPANDNGKMNGDNLDGDDADNVICSGESTQEKRCRKLSMVREPILQLVKRQKSQAAC